MSPADLPHFLRTEFPLVNRHPDIAGLLRQPDTLAALGPALGAPFRDQQATVVLSPEARGPVVGALTAQWLGCGLMLARKEGGNHPGADLTTSGGVGWRGSTEVFQARSFDLSADDDVLIVDDWVTTGSSLRALADLVTACGARVIGASVIVDKPTARRDIDLPVHALVRFDEISGVDRPDR